MLTLLGPGGRPLIETFNSARWDAFESWSHDRATGFANAPSAPSAARLPYELRPYGPALDRDGRWDYVDPHGYVWFPSVGVSWRPYYDGSWSFTRYGWTWHGRDRWAWPTHHYGRWGFTGASWYWIPASAWAPAWVSWSIAPGYVGWAPLGWHVPGRVDVWDRRDHPAYFPRYSPWRGWTVLPRQQFGPRRDVRVHAIDGDRLDAVTRRVLLRSAAPTRAVDDVAVPRDSVVAPGLRGNVRRPPPPPSRRREAPTGAPSPPGNDRRADDPASAPPRSWSGAAGRVGGRDTGDRGDAQRGGDSGASAPARRGAVRDPGGARTAPSQPKSGAPTARSPGAKSDAAGAVRRPGGGRPKG
jgi:hypothetical protein